MKNTYLSSAFLIGLALALSSAALLQRMGLPVRWLAHETTHALAAPLASPSTGAYTVDWSTLDSGGGELSGGVYQVQTTLAQPDAGLMSGGVFILEGGYWPGTANPWHIYISMISR